jgi:uncharacterized protein YfiM (DUF2279 family)
MARRTKFFALAGSAAEAEAGTEPEDDSAWRRRKAQRRLVFAGVLAASAAASVLAACSSWPSPDRAW